jgi:hypothetical protein
MAKREVNCIDKSGSQLEAHERIQHIGYEGKWRLAEDEAIHRIESRQDSFYVCVGGKEVAIMVAVHRGRKYLAVSFCLPPLEAAGLCAPQRTRLTRESPICGFLSLQRLRQSVTRAWLQVMHYHEFADLSVFRVPGRNTRTHC